MNGGLTYRLTSALSLATGGQNKPRVRSSARRNFGANLKTFRDVPSPFFPLQVRRNVLDRASKIFYPEKRPRLSGISQVTVRPCCINTSLLSTLQIKCFEKVEDQFKAIWLRLT